MDVFSYKLGKKSGGTTDYSQLINKPSINNVELDGNKTLSDLGIESLSEDQVKTLIYNAGAVEVNENEIQKIKEYYGLGESDKFKISYIFDYYKSGILKFKCTTPMRIDLNSVGYADIYDNTIMLLTPNPRFVLSFYTQPGYLYTQGRIFSHNSYSFSAGIDFYADTTSLDANQVLNNIKTILSRNKLVYVDSFSSNIYIQDQTLFYNYIPKVADANAQTPTNDAHLTTKKYVDDSITTLSTNNIAPLYSASSTYQVGSYVMYNNQLYICNTAITTAEEWTAAHWTATTVIEIVGNINSLMDMFVTVDEEEY